MPSNRLLIFIVAYNAEKTLKSVLERIPTALRTENTEVLVIDDCSTDDTYNVGLSLQQVLNDCLKVTILRNPQNLGYGGNQKLGFRYAIEQGFDIVALIHGDGQYAPEELPRLLKPLQDKEADIVFGSRMLRKNDALKGGMPFYKWVGNQILTHFQNLLIGTKLSEYHSGYRVYTTNALRTIPFERNADNFHFDTDIIIQAHFACLRIRELPIPTFYGEEVCHVNGLLYAWNILKSSIRGRMHLMNLCYDRKFDLGQPEFNYDLKLNFTSSHTLAIESVREGSAILDIGCGQGLLASEISHKASQIKGLDKYIVQKNQGNITFIQWDLNSADIPVDVSEFDQILLLDVIEHLSDPELFMENLRKPIAKRRPEIIITVPNIGFIVMRIMLLFGYFNYGRKGILDRTHTRLFTFQSIHSLLRQTGYKVKIMKGIPAPFPKAIGENVISKTLLLFNKVGIYLFRGLFSYQIFIIAVAVPTVSQLLKESCESSNRNLPNSK
jgi:glycosyltransferase involved in cell wall biosynthesis